MSSRSSYKCLTRVWIFCFGFKRNLVELHICFVFRSIFWRVILMTSLLSNVL